MRTDVTSPATPPHLAAVRAWSSACLALGLVAAAVAWAEHGSRSGAVAQCAGHHLAWSHAGEALGGMSHGGDVVVTCLDEAGEEHVFLSDGLK